ncbi:MAG: pyridine nucleotide-disulfide oxidoreductase, partial [Micrococcaceae bacterium]|nr:pyridine nucleotide-disulfide oxidoreductase [Micrococcaceae bacterium]
LHFLHAPVEITGSNGSVEAIRFERQELDGTGNVRGTGELVDYGVQAVYRAIGYFGSELAEIGFDPNRGVIPNEGGRVLHDDGQKIPGLYATGWIKRGPVGLIGSTKGDALETIGNLLEDRLELPAAVHPDEQAIIDLLKQREVAFTTWEGWVALDAHEHSLGEAAGAVETSRGPVSRERVKVVEREEMVRISQQP